MKQTINQYKTGLSLRELRQLLAFTPETVAIDQVSKTKNFTAAQYWSLERRRRLTSDRRRLSAL